MEQKDIFLGGTCNDSTWRRECIGYLMRLRPEYTWFDPVVDDWTPECKKIEDQQKAGAKIQIYTITPRMTGVFSVAEMADASNKIPDHTYCVLLEKDGPHRWTTGQFKSMQAVMELCQSNGAHCFTSILDMVKAIPPKPPIKV